jgi:4-amino-4-deoxy-L-arabinose transferase-like glycosyltransferase
MKKTLILLLTALVFVLAFSFQGIRGIWQPDEGYYTGTAITMELHDDYLVPRLGEEIFLDKPPLLYWGILLGIKIFGYSEFSARFFPGLCYALTCFLVFDLGRCLFGRFRDGLWSAVIYATMIIPFSAANFVTMDTPLALFTTLSMAAFCRSVRPAAKHWVFWKMILCAAVGLGFLTKGPAALIPCGAMFIYILIRKEAVSYFATPWALAGIVLFGLFGLSWYVYVSFVLPNAADYFFVSQIWGRLVSDQYQRNPGLSGALLYLPVLLLGTLPWSPSWFRQENGIQRFFTASAWKRLMTEPSSLLLACWICIPMVVLSLASSKLGLYALPVFPALALSTSRLITYPSAPPGRSPLKGLLKRISFLSIWTVFLLASRMLLGVIPSGNDCRALWRELKPYLPKGDYEVVAVDGRVDGLLFYGAMEVENITRKSTPYPAYIPPETIEKEVKDMLEDRFPHLLLIHNSKHIPEIKSVLSEARWNIEEITLRHDRWLLLCRPGDESL